MAKKSTKHPQPPVAKDARVFYVIGPADRSDLDCVEDVEAGNFDEHAIEHGDSFDGVFPKDFKVWLDRSKPTDLPGGPQSWLLVSEKVIQATQDLVTDQVEVYDIPVFDLETKKRVKGYKLLHILGSLKSAARVNGKVMSNISQGIVFDRSKIPLETNIFRMREASTFIVVSDKVRKALQAAGAVGIEYIKTSAI